MISNDIQFGYHDIRAKGKGPAAGCFKCGDPQYATECRSPAPTWSQPQWTQGETLRSLCCRREVDNPVDEDGYTLVIRKKKEQTKVVKPDDMKKALSDKDGAENIRQDKRLLSVFGK
jgi:hypothetical protein